MWTNSSDPAAVDTPDTAAERTVRVGVADLAVTEGATLTSSGLGSCVGVAVYPDSNVVVGGLLHAMLPEVGERSDGRLGVAAKYVDAGLAELVSRLERAGADRADLVAKVAGGSEMLKLDVGPPVGGRNVAAARDALNELGVDLVAEDVGGDHGRSLRFEPPTGAFVVTSAHGDTVRL